ncbi:MAG: cation:proton antiporter [Myxococcota bacterium]
MSTAPIIELGLGLSIALGVGVLAQSLARHLHVPGIVVLLASGVLLGPDVLAWVDPSRLGIGLLEIVHLGVALILFEGGLNLEFSRLRRESGPIRRLISVGAIVTLAGAAAATHGVLGWSWGPSVLFGSLVVVTGPTVVTPLLRELRLQRRVATVLEAEGVLIDPIGAIFAVLVLQVVLEPEVDLGIETAALVQRIGLGLLAGSLAGLMLAGLLRARRLVPEGHENIFTLASVLLLFHGCDALVSQSGILAVMVAGIWVGNLRTRVDRDLREFKDQLTVLLIGLLFVLLAADVRIADLRALGWPAAGVIALLVLLVRPLCVWISTVGSELSGRERLLLAWLAPRGIVAAAIASLTAELMEQKGVGGGQELRALVFLTIGSTVLLAGATARPAAWLLGLRLPARETVAILGAQGLGLMLADELRRAGVPVLLIDANPQQCRRAEEAGLPVVFGNALEERTLARARFEQVGAAIGLTANETLNSLFVEQASELFGVPETYVAVLSEESGVTPEFLAQRGTRMLFEAAHDVERWDVRSRHREIAREPLVFAPEEPGSDPEPGAAVETLSGEAFVMLAIRRGSSAFPMWAGFTPRVGDRATLAVHKPERGEALAALRRIGWQSDVPQET